MNLEKYPVKSEPDMMRHEFYSEGPKGRIKKIVRFQHVGSDFYNLAFGGEQKDGRLDVEVRDNNNDVEKILATVCSTVVEFMKLYPTASVMAKGDVEAKTRLYQMKINKHLVAISLMITIQGWLTYEWENFRSRKNYEAFLVKAKEKN